MLSLFITSAMAEWTFAGKNDEFDIYFHAATLRKLNNKVKMWELVDYKSGRENASSKKLYWSAKSQFEYDCVEVQSRMLTLSQFAEPKGRGNVVYSDSSASEWEPIAPDSIGYALWKLACGKK